MDGRVRCVLRASWQPCGSADKDLTASRRSARSGMVDGVSPYTHVETSGRFLEGDMLHRRSVDACGPCLMNTVGDIFRAGRWRAAPRAGLVRSPPG